MQREDEASEWANFLSKGNYPKSFFRNFGCLVLFFIVLMTPSFMFDNALTEGILLEVTSAFKDDHNVDYLVNYYLPNARSILAPIKVDLIDWLNLARMAYGLVSKVLLALAFKGGLDEAPLGGILESEFFVAIGGILMPVVNIVSDLVAGSP